MNNLDINQVIDYVLQNVMDQKSQLYSKVQPQNIMDQIEKEQLYQIETRWEDKNKKMNMIDFVRLLVSIIEHKQKELIFLVMGLIELFKEMVISTNSNQNYLMLTDITSYICEKTDSQDFEVKILEQRVPAPRQFEQNLDRIRQIDVEAPEVVKQTTLLSHIMPNKIKTDKVKHTNGSVQSGTYIEELNKIVTLDSLGTKLNVYDLDCQIDSYITLKNPTQKLDEDKEAIILGFAWSSRQQRIGLTLKSSYLCFFDESDNFQLPRIFQTSQFSQDHQTSIWCLNNYNYWITTDASNKLYRWDIQEQQPVFIFQSSKIKSAIIEVVEVLHLKLMATASLDKQIAFWDIQRGQIKIQINMEEHGGIHSMIYSYSYQVIITCGYSTNIQIFQIHPIYMDVTLVGKLQGHVSMLTAIQMLGVSPILCSGDDIGNIRLWNIKNFQCVQCLSYGRRTQILKLLDISCRGLVCFLGSRLNLIQLDDRQKAKTNENYAMGIEFYPHSEHLVVASRRELLFINIHTGRIKKFYSSLLPDEEDEIVQFKSTNHFNRFILGDSRGALNLYQSSNGEFLKQMKGHQTEVTHLKTDINNNLIISASWDQFQVQRELVGNGVSGEEPELLREVVRFQQGTEITFFEVSVHHNIILAASLSKLSIYDFELFRLLGEVDSDSNDITFLTFIRLYNIFALGTNVIKIFSYVVRNQQEIHLDIIAVIDPYYLLKDIKHVPYTPEHTNSARQLHSKGSKQFDTFMTEVWKVPQEHLSYNPQLIPSVMREGEDVPTRCLVSQEEHSLELYIATNKGNLFIVNIAVIVTLFQLQPSKHSFEKLNYNPYRATKEDYTKQLNTCKQSTFMSQSYVDKHHRNILLIPKHALRLNIAAQKKAINCLYILQLDRNYLATTATNGFINIHSIQDGILVASLNINHPLPILWSLVYTKREQLRKKIVYALKIVEVLHKQVQSDTDKQIYNIGNLVSSFLGPDPFKPAAIARKQGQSRRSSKILTFPTITPLPKIQEKPTTLQTESTNRVIIMGDEYSPRDLQFHQIRKLYISELQGPSIKQMDSQTRFQEAYTQIKSDEIAQVENEKMYEQKEMEKIKISERGGQMDFLDQYYHDKVVDHFQPRNNSVRLGLETKLDTCVRSGVVKVASQMTFTDSEKPRTKRLLLQANKKQDKAKSLQSRDFFLYANDKNLISAVSSPLSSQVASTQRSNFNPTFFMKNIDQVDSIMMDNPQKWLGGQKKKKFQLANVLQNLNIKVSKSRNHCVDQELGIINKNQSQMFCKIGHGEDTLNKEVIDSRYHEMQIQADKEIDKLVASIQSKVQLSLKLKHAQKK